MAERKVKEASSAQEEFNFRAVLASFSLVSSENNKLHRSCFLGNAKWAHSSHLDPLLPSFSLQDQSTSTRLPLISFGGSREGEDFFDQSSVPFPLPPLPPTTITVPFEDVVTETSEPSPYASATSRLCLKLLEVLEMDGGGADPPLPPSLLLRRLLSEVLSLQDLVDQLNSAYLNPWANPRNRRRP